MERAAVSARGQPSVACVHVGLGEAVERIRVRDAG